ncbi:MAG: glycogen debranching enzyme N-terminal domain-containing protein, partial [Myxococcota bacterium]
MSGEGREWLETDGWGGFASGTADLVRTRRYHGLLLVAARPPADRWMLVNGWEGWLVGAQGERLPLTSQAYRDVVYPNGREYLEVFAHEPWPRWSYRIDEETRLDVELIVPGEGPGTVLSFSLHGGTERWRSIDLRLLCSGRDPHHLRSADGDPKVGLEVAGCRLGYELNPGAPPFFVWGAHKYRHAPEWFRQFEYAEERARGLDAYEDLLSPGHFELDLREGAAALILS